MPPVRRPLLAPLLLLTAQVLLLTSCQAQRPASESSCRSTYASFNQNDLIIRLAPCQSGATADCCNAGQNLAGFRANAPLPGCLCYKSTLEELLMTAETNTLARSAGVTQQLIISILQQCGTPYYGGTGASRCPSVSSQPSGTAPAPAPAPSGGPGPAPQSPSTPEGAPEPSGQPSKAPENKKAQANKGPGFGHGELIKAALKWHEEKHPLSKALNHG